MLNFNPLTKVTGFFSAKVLLVIAVCGFTASSAIIYYQKVQKAGLRQDIIELNNQIVASKASYVMCLGQIDIISKDHNDQLLKQVEQSKLNNQKLKNEINALINDTLLESNKKLNKVKGVVEKYDWSKESPPEEILGMINEKS
jgi:hypothetical protein